MNISALNNDFVSTVVVSADEISVSGFGKSVDSLSIASCSGTAGTFGSAGTLCGCLGTFGTAGSYGCGE